MITAQGDSDYLKVYVSGLLHFHFLRKHFRGLSSYHENIYTIEILLKNQTLTLEYDQRQVWEEVLKTLDENT